MADTSISVCTMFIHKFKDKQKLNFIISKQQLQLTVTQTGERNALECISIRHARRTRYRSPAQYLVSADLAQPGASSRGHWPATGEASLALGIVQYANVNVQMKFVSYTTKTYNSSIFF